LVLCYLQGKTNEQAAQILGCPRGSMAARLDQARERLRECLVRRGFAVPAAGLAVALAAASAEAAVPLPLLANTVRAAVWFAGEQAGGAGFLSGGAVALARGACRAMALGGLKVAAAVLLVSALLGAGASMLLRAAAPPAGPPPEARPERAEVGGEPLPRGVVARLGTRQLRHGDAVSFAAHTPDGKRLLTAGRDRTVRLWDLASGKEIRRFAWGAVPPDGKADPSQDGAYEQTQQQVIDDLGWSSEAALSADGKTVAASRGGVVCLWETATGKMLRQLQTGQKRLVQLAFSADGKSLLTLGPNGLTVAVWDVVTGKCLRRIHGKPRAGYRGDGFGPISEQKALVSPGWKYLAYQWRDPSGVRRIHVRELATGKELPPIHVGGYGGLLAFCFSADDRTLLWDDWCAAGGIVFSDVATGKELRRLGDQRPGYRRADMTLAIALSADGKSLAVCRTSHTIDLWDLASGKPTYPVGQATEVQREQWFTDWVGAHVRPALAFSPDGTKLVCSLGSAAIRRFQVDTGKEIRPGSGHRAPVSTLALSADGKALSTFGSGEQARFWDWATGKETRPAGVPAGATHAAFAGEGRFAFAVGNQVTLCGPAGKKTWRIAAGEFPPLAALALSPDGAVLATRSYDNPEVHLWDATGKRRQALGSAEPQVGNVDSEAAGVVTPEVVFSPDGRTLAAAGPRLQLCLWDVARGTLLWEVPPQAGQAIERFAFSPGGLFLATVHSDRTVTLYEARSGAERARLGKPDLKKRRLYRAYNYYGKLRLSQTWRAVPVCLAFSPDGRYLAMARGTPAIHLWDVVAGREVGRLQGHEGGVLSLAFTPDGRHLLSGSSDTTALCWDLARLTRPRPARAARLPGRALEALWADLASSDAARAFAAIRKLCSSPDQAVTLIQQRVRPARPVDPKQLSRLLADLQGERFEQRRRATAELAGLGELAEPALRRALAGDPPLGLRQRLERLLKLSAQAPPAGQLRELRAVEVLELLGTPPARQVLKALAGGAAGARLTREAGGASQRLAKLAPRP
jgi:WD40 repeat protein